MSGRNNAMSSEELAAKRSALQTALGNRAGRLQAWQYDALIAERYVTPEDLLDATERSLKEILKADSAVDTVLAWQRETKQGSVSTGGAGGPGLAELSQAELEAKLWAKLGAELEAKLGATLRAELRAEFDTLQQSLKRNAQRSITTWADRGRAAMERASVIPPSKDFPPKALLLPDSITSAFKEAWQHVTTQPELQALALQAVRAMVTALQQAGLQVQFHVLDTHRSGHYKNPIAKIDIALSASPTALWLSFVMPIELKLDLTCEQEYQEAVGQLLDRFEKMREECPDRRKMLGVAWDCSCIDFWRFEGGEGLGDYTCAHTGLVPFDWDVGNAGYQMLAGLLSHDLARFGYIPLAVPAPCNIGGVELSDFMPLAGAAAHQRVVYTAKAEYFEETVVVKIGTQQQMAAEADMLQRYQSVTAVLPELLGHGRLTHTFKGLTYGYVSRPLGVHMEESMGEQQLLSAMKQIARGLEQLAKGTRESRGLLHRDVSPDNMVVVQQDDESYKAYLLDLHVARSVRDPGHPAAVNEPLTGKRRYWALRLKEEGHSLAADLESLFYSFLHIASAGRALRWRHAMDDQAIFEAKFTTMYYPPAWQAALKACTTCQRALDALHDKIFCGSYTLYLEQQLTADDFVNALTGPSAAQG